MAKKVVTLYIDDYSVRLLEATGEQVTKWADLTLEVGLIRDGIVADEEKLTAEIEELFKAQKINAKKVILGLSGLHCLSQMITLPRLPKAMLPEAVKQEAERNLPVPLDQLYLSWQVISEDDEKMYVFVAALPRSAADTMIKVIRKVGVDPYIIDLKPVVLTRVVKDATAVVVDVQTTEFDITVVVDGMPHPIRTVPLPDGKIPMQEKLPMIRDELERTIAFYNSVHPDNQLDTSLPVYISGELTDDPELYQSLSDEIEYEVLRLSSPLKYSQDLVPGRYMVNIGLALKEVSVKEDAIPALVNINMMPEIYRFKPFSGIKAFIRPAIVVVAVGLLFPLVMVLQNVTSETASLQVKLEVVEQTIAQKQGNQVKLKKDIAQLEEKIAQTELANDIFTSVLDYFDRQQEIVNGDMIVTLAVLPVQIDLTGVRQGNNVLTIQGVSPSEVEVLTYAGNLRKSDRFYPTIVSGITVEEEFGEEWVSFTLTLNHKEEVP
ncbi:pilus assembly protein PilM [Chloroflexota bacterium]